MLTRSYEETLVIQAGPHLIRITIGEIRYKKGGGKVRLLCDAPPEVLIDREEIYESKMKGEKPDVSA